MTEDEATQTSKESFLAGFICTTESCVVGDEWCVIVKCKDLMSLPYICVKHMPSCVSIIQASKRGNKVVLRLM